MYSSLTGSQSFQTPPKDSKSNSVDVQHTDNLNKGKRKLVSSSDVMSTKRPNITARKLCEPVAKYRPKKFTNQGKADKLFNLLLRTNKFVATEVFNAPVMHSAVPDMTVPITGDEIKRQFGKGEFLDGATMDYIIDEMKTTSKLYDTGERVLLSQGFIMYVLQVSIWTQLTEEIKEAAAKKGKTFNYTEDFNMQIALDAFPRYVDKGKSLLDAKLDQVRWTLLNVYTKAEITLPSIRNVGIHPDDHFRYHCEMASLVLLKIQITGEPFLVEGARSGPRVISSPLNEDVANVNAGGQDSRIWFLASGLGGYIILVCIRGQGEAVGIPTNYKGKNVWNCPFLHCEVYARNGQVADPVDPVWVRQGDLQGSSLFLGVNYPFLLDAPEPEAGNAGNTFPLFKPDCVFAAPNYVNHVLRF
ncbi:hypothetical protein ACQ4PT_008839 [Festuca glaucescens]